MLRKPVKSWEDFSGGLVTKGSVLKIKENQSPDLMNYHTNIFGSLVKRLGFSKVNSSSAEGIAYGAFHYVQSATVQQLVAFFGKIPKKMDLTNNVWDGAWDTIAKHANGTAFTADLAYFSTWSANGTLIMTTESQDKPQRINATDTTHIDLDNGGSGTAPSGKYSAVWKDHTWIANISGALDRLQRSANGTYDDWDGTDSGSTDIVTGGDIGLTGLIIYKGKLYVFKRWSIHRVTYLGGTPLLDYKEIDSSIGTDSPRTIIKVNVPGKGEVIHFLGTDRQFYEFDGWEAKAISEPISTSNGISDIYLENITAEKLKRAHAVNYASQHKALFFLPIGTTGGDDSNTKLLLHMNGADGTNSFSDASDSAHTITPTNAVLDTDQKKFGTASGLFDGTGDYLTAADSADWDFDSGDFTLDFQARFNVLPSTGAVMMVIQSFTDISNHWVVQIQNTTDEYYLVFNNFNPATTLNIKKKITVSTNVWYHFAVVRSGDDFLMFQDGIQVGTTVTDSSDVDNFTGSLYIGSNGGSSSFFNGWLDEIRISKGVARWTADFTAPTAPYGTVPNYCVAYDYLAKSFWPYDNMNFLSSCVADNGTGQRKIYVQGLDYLYLFDDTYADDGTAINAYWTSKKNDLGSVPSLKKMFFTSLITNNAAYNLTFQQRQDWESAYSTAKTVTASQEKDVMRTFRLGNLIQYKLVDNSSVVGSQIDRIDLSAQPIGVGG